MTDRLKRGMAVRREVLGDAHVDAAESAKTDFDTPFQELITESAWGRLWADDTISRRERSMLTLALLAATGNFEEIPMHVRACRNTGASADDIMQAFLHVAIYAGVPKANHAIKLARQVLADADASSADRSDASGSAATFPDCTDEPENRKSSEGLVGSFLPRDRVWHPNAFHQAYKSSILRSPKAPLLAFPSSLSEETGPVFGHDIIGELDADLLHNFAQPGESAIGPRIIVHGNVLDERGRGIPDVLLEIWQANAGGRYRHAREGYIAPLDPNFSGCGRVMSDASGRYEFRTVAPGPYPWPNGPNDWRPAHIHFSVFGHAFAQRLVTQMYFEGDPLIQRCPIVGAISQAEATKTLIASLDMDRTLPMDALAYRFDIVLRGLHETAFESGRS